MYHNSANYVLNKCVFFKSLRFTSFSKIHDIFSKITGFCCSVFQPLEVVALALFQAEKMEEFDLFETEAEILKMLSLCAAVTTVCGCSFICYSPHSRGVLHLTVC